MSQIPGIKALHNHMVAITCQGLTQAETKQSILIGVLCRKETGTISLYPIPISKPIHICIQSSFRHYGVCALSPIPINPPAMPVIRR